MKKEITTGQALGIAVSVLICIVTGWITMNNKVTRLETEMATQKIESYNQQLASEARYNKMDNKIDNIAADITKILIALERKQDRK